MLKIADHDDERIGGSVMQWWNGEGAARVLAATALPFCSNARKARRRSP